MTQKTLLMAHPAAAAAVTFAFPLNGLMFWSYFRLDQVPEGNAAAGFYRPANSITTLKKH